MQQRATAHALEILNGGEENNSIMKTTTPEPRVIMKRNPRSNFEQQSGYMGTNGSVTKSLRTQGKLTDA